MQDMSPFRGAGGSRTAVLLCPRRPAGYNGADAQSAGETMDEKADVRPEKVDRLVEAAREMAATPEEMHAAAREQAEYERWLDAMWQEALDDEAAGDEGRPAEEVFAEFLADVEGRIRAEPR